MNDEWFRKLKEFDSLTNMKSCYLGQMDEQKKRLNVLNLKRQEKEESIKNALKLIHELQQQYHDTEKRLLTSEQQSQRLRDAGASDEKLSTYLKEAELLETQMFEQLERIEALESEMEDSKTFLKGLDKTYEEIAQEVQAEISKQQSEIFQIDSRLELILNILPMDFKNALEKTLKKKLALGPFTRTDQSHCYFCRYKISRTEESEIDVQKLLKFCPQCSRIFLPYGC